VAEIEIKNVPDDVYEELGRRARLESVSISDFVLRLIERDLRCGSVFERLEGRPRTKLDRPAADLIREEREEREAHLQRVFDERNR
jgi:predicted CopG family antitoxin